MSGRRRLAELLAMASATRNIIRRHVDMQLDHVSRLAATSSVTNAIKRNLGGSPTITYSPSPRKTSPSKPTNPTQDQHVRNMSSTHRPVPSETAGDTTESSNLRRNMDEDVYYETQATTTPN